MRGRDEQIAFVLAVVVVGHDDELAAREGRDHVFNATLDVVQFSLPVSDRHSGRAESVGPE